MFVIDPSLLSTSVYDVLIQLQMVFGAIGQNGKIVQLLVARGEQRGFVPVIAQQTVLGKALKPKHVL